MDDMGGGVGWPCPTSGWWSPDTDTVREDLRGTGMLKVIFPRAQSVTGGSPLLLGILPKLEVRRCLEFGHVPDCGEERMGDEDGEMGGNMRGEGGVGTVGM